MALYKPSKQSGATRKRVVVRKEVVNLPHGTEKLFIRVRKRTLSV